MNMTYNPEFAVGIQNHASRKHAEQQRCQTQYMKNETFRQSVRDALPNLRAWERIYKVATEVNRFQKEELQQCAGDEHK